MLGTVYLAYLVSLIPFRLSLQVMLLNEKQTTNVHIPPISVCVCVV